MIYEFKCPSGHVTEASVPMGTKEWPCSACNALDPSQPHPWASRILSPTRTTFVFADTHRKHWR